MRRVRLWWLCWRWSRHRSAELRWAMADAEVLSDAAVILTAWELWYGPEEIG